ncbi:MAG: SOS response-associated peptidase [Deltaproteobacteria bacterium]|nr:SOS response-associated peptidase [Deltaproteobacteria bacterium]
MCGHFSIDYLKIAQLIERFSLSQVHGASPPVDLKTTNDYYPSHGKTHAYVPTILNENGIRTLQLLRWDLIPGWWNKSLIEKNYVSFNARSDSIKKKATFKKAWLEGRRCIFPATSFYEWPAKKLIKSGTKRMEHKISLQKTLVFSMAGIWDSCVLPDSNVPFRSCAIITTEANKAIAQIPHTRMPVILTQEEEDKWLDINVTPDSAFQMLHQYPEEEMIVKTHSIR